MTFDVPGGRVDAAADAPVVVLGIGNVLWADEGFGVRGVESLQRRYRFAPHVELVDGGTQGLYLTPYVQRAKRLLILDAIDYGLPPGTLRRIDGDDVPRFLGAKKMSLHQTGFQEVLQLALLTGQFPDEIVLIGCQPEAFDDYGGSLRPVVRAALERAVELAHDVLLEWGARPVARAGGLPDDEAVTARELRIDAYEVDRPSEQLACRVGDERILARRQ